MNRKALTARVRRALDRAPCSLRRLAREADVPHSTLVRIQKGEREATLDVAHRVARALSAWGKQCQKLAEAVERATRQIRKEV
jgi:transcriptional regulator with XRE-family HTH domain